MSQQPPNVEAPPALCPRTAVFAHATNSTAKVAAALASPGVNFLEADVITAAAEDGSGVIAVMGHDPGAAYDLTFEAFIDAVAGTGKGVKVDIKEWAAVAPVLAVLKAKEEAADGARPWPLMRFTHAGLGSSSSRPAADAAATFFDRPALFINADVLPGPGVSIIPEEDAPPPPLSQLRKPGCRFNPQGRVLPLVQQIFVARGFIEQVLAALPSATLSLGWTTSGDYNSYSSEHVQDMLFVVGDWPRAGVGITYAVRASYLRTSLTSDRLLRLLGSEADPDASPARAFPAHGGSTFTIWSNVPLSAADDAFLRSGAGGALPLDRVMFDMCPPAAEEAKTWWANMTPRKAAAVAFGVAGLSAAVVLGVKLARR